MNWVFKQSVLRQLLLDLLYLKDSAVKKHSEDEYYYVILRSSWSNDVFYEIGGEIIRDTEDNATIRNVWINCAFSDGDIKKMCLLSYDTFYDMTPETYKELSLGLAAIIHNASERVATARLNTDPEVPKVSVEETRLLRTKVDAVLLEGMRHFEEETNEVVYDFDTETLRKINEEFTMLFCGKPVEAVEL
jgi:hypothetical protein